MSAAAIRDVASLAEPPPQPASAATPPSAARHPISR
jgi:hypothetical protein